MSLVWSRLIGRSAFKIVDRNIMSRSFVFVASLFVFQFSFGQEPATQEASSNEAIEEIIVSAPPSIRNMKIEVTKAKSLVFSLFNDLNEDSSYDIICKRERPQKTGPMSVTWSKRVCLTSYLRAEEKQAYKDYLDGFGDGTLSHLTDEILERGDTLVQKLNDLMKENPEFFKAMYNYTLLTKNYERALAENKETSFFAKYFGPN